MKHIFCPKARTENLVIQTLPGETLVYDMTTNEAHCLNETAAFVWGSCNGNISIDEIAKSVEARFGNPGNADFVGLAIAQLNERKLLTETGLDAPQVTNRREAIKKIGLASAIAIPVIASIIAPPSVLANVSCGCNSPIDCIGQAGNACPPNAFACNPSGICVVQ